MNINAVCYSNKKKSITAKSNSQTPPREKLPCPPHCFHLYMHICTETKRDSLGPRDDVEARVKNLHFI